MIAIDSNLLVYAHRGGLAQHRAARAAIEKASLDPRGWGIALPCLAEFWSVVTHPANQGGPSSGQEARDFLGALIMEGGAAVWLPGDGFAERLLRVAADLRVEGRRIYDLQIAFIAFENGASEIWTHDHGFCSLPGLAVRNVLPSFT